MKYKIISILLSIATFCLWGVFVLSHNMNLIVFLGLGVGFNCGITFASSLRDLRERKKMNAYYKSLRERMHKERTDATEK